jgi:multimeric flavodoxin WrbA
MNILVLVAGTNEPSNSNALADAFIQGMQQYGQSKINKIRLKDLTIHHFTVDYYEPQCSMEEDFCAVQDLMLNAHGFVIVTPVWNFGVPAHLKNLIDRIGAFALDATRSRGTLKGKPFYLIFTGGVSMPGWSALMKKTTSHLPESLKYFGASYMGHHFEGKCTVGRGKFGLVVDQRPESIEAVRRKGFDFAKVVAEYEKTGKAPVKQRAMGKIMKWGEAVLKKVT